MTRPRLLLALLCLLSFPGLAHAWWNDAWAYRKKITFDTTAAGADAKQGLAEVPVLVRLHSGNFVFLDAVEGGADLRFVAADEKTPLRHHIEQWDAVNQLAFVWVRVPAVAAASNADHIWLYYGNKEARAEDDPKQRYDTGQVLVLHFAEPADSFKDASPFAHPVAARGATAQEQGPIGRAAAFNGSASVVAAATPTLASGAQGLTLSAWVRIAGPQGRAQLVTQQDVSLEIAGSRPLLKAGAAVATATQDLAPNRWYHVAGTVSGGKAMLFVDGRAAAEAATQVVATAGEVIVGAGLQGDLDEVQVSSLARSEEWIRAAWAGQGPEPRLASVGEDEQNAGGGGHSYFNILLGAVTLDGWVVIAILVVMMVISFVVMIGKAAFVRRTDKANRSFLSAFSSDPAGMLDPARAEAAPAHLASSSLFRLYKVGIRELKSRLDRYREQGRPEALSPQALGAIRSSLDAAMVRESARLNAQMVLLTIAISGGPFLGLLGTVVGVMITFAAIAAAGDVNVNSIAPGIAAALVATVAGLAVAIPALFGYNYLAAQIKNVSNEMTVFVDELLNRMAEKYEP
jgi:biopolymer transport protein ExbB